MEGTIERFAKAGQTVGVEGQVAVVTGAASGIGLELSRCFAGAGMNVVMADVNEVALLDAAGGLSRETGVDVLPLAVDVRRWDSVDELAAKSFDRFGAVHVLCNNAGVVPSRKALWEYELDDWRWVIDVDLWGVIHGVKAFLPRMIETGQPGHVVNTASIGGLLPLFPHLGPYSTAKTAVVALSESLNAGLAQQRVPIGVSALCPAMVATPLKSNSARSSPDRDADWGEEITLARSDAIPAAEVAALVMTAIRDRRFWVVPHEQYLEQIEERGRRIRSGADERESPDS